MKAFIHRTFNRSSSLKDKDGKEAATAREAAAAVASREKSNLPTLPPLPEWPPPQHRPPSAASQASFKPLPDISARPLPPIQDEALPASLETESDPGCNPRAKQRGPSTTSNGNSDVQKKVAFLSPPSTPSAPPVRPSETAERKMTPPAPDAPAKSAITRLQAEARSSTPNATSSKMNLGNGATKAGTISTRATTTRGTMSPQRFHESTVSVRSGTPYSTNSANTSRILATASWSEAAEEDLVSNLGSRERTRQEVLWEIVASEERYVAELLKMKDTFIDPLLHPFASSPVASPTLPEADEYYGNRMGAASPQESLDHLPIAARFLSPLSFEGPPTQPSQAQGFRTPVIDGDSMESDEEERKGHIQEAAAKLNHPRSPYRARNNGGTTRNGKILPFPSRSHHSLPPPPRPDQGTSSTASLGRQSFVGPSADDSRKATATPAQRVFRKLKKSQTGLTPIEGAIAPHLLPDDLRRCLEVIEAGILNGHFVLSEGLRKRYEEQYPLVRSLADIFVTNSHILREYATYVLHLERALEQVDDALTLANVTKRPKKQTEAEWLKLSKYLQRLEENAADKGETGLAISLSKPFQRLLKYPLLFQNLLFHTDPSTYEYESTLQMVAEVETIVRSIEDEKIQKEERDRTRDVFARIEGLDKVKQLAVPKPSRVLVEEKMVSLEPGRESATSPIPKGGTPPSAAKNVKGKSSFRRLSDVLQPGSNGIGGKKDLWLVVFNDVVLRCQRTGTTSLPIVSTTSMNSRSNSLPDLQGSKSKFATASRRNSHSKPRNLYKFIKIETWVMGDEAAPQGGIVSMEDISRSRALAASGTAKTTPSKPTDDEDDPALDSDDSDRKSKMSFSYWGADKITLSPTATSTAKARSPLGRGAPRGRVSGPSSYTSRESSANAKFGTRLINSPDSSPARPASRKAITPSSRRTAVTTTTTTDDMKSTTTSSKPDWNSSTRATSVTSSTGVRRPRNISQGSSQPPRAKIASPAPSEDSGVGLYRQMLAQDPSLSIASNK